MKSSDRHPTRIRLDDDRRERVLAALRGFFETEFDLPLSPLQADRALDFLVVELGAPVYNQAIADARKFMIDRLEDLDTEFYEPERTGDDS